MVLWDRYVHLENRDAVFEIGGAPFVQQAVTSSCQPSVQRSLPGTVARNCRVCSTSSPQA